MIKNIINDTIGFVSTERHQAEERCLMIDYSQAHKAKASF